VETQVTEIAPDVYRLSTYVGDANLVFNQFLVDADEPLLFHTGLRGLFPLVSAAVERVLPVERLRWITFGHLEADECGAMNSWLTAAPQAEVAHGAMGCAVSVNDLADRPPRPLQDGEVLDLGGRRLRRIETPHVPHGWDAGLLYEETTGTLLCGDLFTALGQSPALTEQEITGPALQAEDLFRATCLTQPPARRSGRWRSCGRPRSASCTAPPSPGTAWRRCATSPTPTTGGSRPRESDSTGRCHRGRSCGTDSPRRTVSRRWQRQPGAVPRV
jgi:flavorubredoxin